MSKSYLIDNQRIVFEDTGKYAWKWGAPLRPGDFLIRRDDSILVVIETIGLDQGVAYTVKIDGRVEWRKGDAIQAPVLPLMVPMPEDASMWEGGNEGEFMRFCEDVADGVYDNDPDFKDRAMQMLGLSLHPKAGAMWEIARDLAHTGETIPVWNVLVAMAPLLED